MLNTEHRSAQYAGLDTWDDDAILSALLESQAQAIACVRDAFSSISRAALDLAERLRAGGRLLYAGAGSSIRQGIVDGIELPATFGFPPDHLNFLVAGGIEALFDSRGAAEDDAASATAEISALQLTAHDSLIAIAASGTTPYAVAAARAANSRGALVIAIANNPRSPLAENAHHEIFLNSGPEVIAGSTRMAAGTAQKCALNLLSTLTHIHLGAVHDGMMVNVRVDNDKLRRRACSIIMAIADVDDRTARHALDESAGEVKCAVLIASGAKDAATAREMLVAATGDLRRALAHLSK